MDVLSKEQRSYCMSQIRSKNTKPEVMLRKILWAKGIRGYRLHAKVTGKPDIYFPKKKIAIFLDGCFWHGCRKCYIKPKTNKNFWSEKLISNRKRDQKVNRILRKTDTNVLRIWQHEIKDDTEKIIQKIESVFNI